MTKKRLTLKQRREMDADRAERYHTRQKELGRKAFTRWATEEERKGMDTWLQAFRQENGTA